MTMSNAQKRRALAIEQTIAALAALFPATFVADSWQRHKPLKLGIHLDLIARGVLVRRECHLGATRLIATCEKQIPSRRCNVSERFATRRCNMPGCALRHVSQRHRTMYWPCLAMNSPSMFDFINRVARGHRAWPWLLVGGLVVGVLI
jgi:sRNA-binding protein